MTLDPNDERTVIDGLSKPAPAPPPVSGQRLDNSLPVGTRLAEFEVLGLVGIGGFSFVYLAHDHSLGRRVALKEYMPQGLASRGEGAEVSAHSARHTETFEAGRRSFVNEARLLAQFDHPSLVKVYRFWEANGTAYMVMPHYTGSTLKATLKQLHAPPDEAWLLRLLAPLLNALEVVHLAQVFHRDISPDNIMLLADDRPVLLDFGAARHVISNMTQALTVILKSGYAPIEQYAEVPGMKQGAWTDLYALAAVVYFAITGTTPMPAVGRMMGDTLEPLARQATGRYSEAFLRAIDSALAVSPSDRPQSVSEMRQLLGLHKPVPGTVSGEGPWTSAVPNSPEPEAQTLRDCLLAEVREQVTLAQDRTQPTVHIDALLPASRALRRSRIRKWGAASLAMGAGTVVAILLLRAGPQTEPSPPTAGAVASSAAASSVDAAPAGAPAARVAQVAQSFNPLVEVDRIFEQRDRNHHVSVAVAQSQVEIGRDKVSFTVHSARAGYLYVLMVGTDRRNFWVLFPNQLDADNHVSAKGRLNLPRKTWELKVGGPPGTDHFVAVVSRNQRDFTASGLSKADIFGEFPLEVAARVAQAASGAASPFIGMPRCTATAGECSAAYGAAVFSIEEVEPKLKALR